MFDYLDYKNRIPLDKCTRGKIPKLNPYSQKYKNYWKQAKRDIIEGYWVEHNGEYKWLPPVLALYNNFWTIEMSHKGSKSQNKTKGTPRLRDIEWIKGFVWAVARGFSGFENDDTYSCNRILISDNRDELISYAPDHVLKSIHNSKGEIKRYKEALAYLYEYKSSNLGKPQFYNPAWNISDVECRNIGKDLRWDSTIYKESGPDIIDNIKIGDRIYDNTGELTTVLDRYDFNNQLQYKITLQDNREVYCGEGHLWGLYDRGKYKVKTLKEIYESQYIWHRKNSYNEYRYRLPLTKEVDFTKKELPIDPYYLGLWLGDGSKNDTVITTADSEIIEYLNSYAKELELEVYKISKYGYRIKTNKSINILRNKLKELNVFNNKHIPEIYKYSSIEQRLELLRGLMDSDGSIYNNGHSEFANKDINLIKEVKYLLDSLGIRNSYKERITTCNNKEFNSYRISINTNLPIFKLSRKLNKLKSFTSIKNNTSRNSVAIINIEPVKIEKSVCIKVDNKDKLFLVNDFVVTHNSMIGGCMIGQNFLTDGSMDYDELIKLRQEGMEPMSETLVSAIDSKYSTGLINKLKLGLDSLPGTIEIGKDVFPSPLSKKYTGSFMSGKHVISEYEKKMGNNWIRVGSKSRILHRSFGDNPFAANGTRPGFTVIDEIGFMGNLLEALGQLAECTTTDGRKFGTIWMTGTGGDMASGATEAIKKVFYDPHAYDCMAFDDIFENKGKIGFFVPAWMALDEFRDELGNVNKELALRKLLREREVAANAKSKAPLYALLQMKPLVPSEAFLVLEGNIFPVGELKEHLASLESTERKKDLGTVGWMQRDKDGKAFFKADHQLVAADYPTKESDNPNGAVVIWEEPTTNVSYGQYVAGIDPYDQDKANNSVSYGSIFIYKRFVNADQTYNLPVAEYTGRPEFANDFYEQCRRLLEWYKCKALYENQNTGLKQYFQTRHCLELLHVQPNIVKSISPNSKVERGYGIHMSKQIKDELEIKVRDWLKEETSPGILQLTKIYSIPLLKELISYNSDGNFDRFISFSLTILQSLELHNITMAEYQEVDEVDKFFSRSLFK